MRIISGQLSRSHLALLLPFSLVSFAVNSLLTRFVVANRLLDSGLLGAVRFIAGAVALVVLALMRHERPTAGRDNMLPAFWLGTYAALISYGYRYIGAAAGTFAFYSSVLLTMMAYDVATGASVPRRRIIGSAVSLSGIAVLARGSVGTATLLGVLLLSSAGVAWGLYTAAGRKVVDPRAASTGNFVVLAAALLVPAAAAAAGGLKMTAEGLAWAVAIGIVTTAFAYLAWYTCQRTMSATGAGSAQLVIPVLTAIGAVVLLGEHLSITLLVAAVLVAAGMWLGRPPSTA